jgi:hypothetical protein
MATRLFTIDKSLPIVWANPDTLHIGFDPPQVILSNVTDDLLLLLHHLGAGTSESGLSMFAKDSGVSPERLADLLEQLAPVLGKTPARVWPNYVLDGPDDLSEPAAHALVSIGHSVLRDTTASNEAEVLILAHFVPEPLHFHSWLRRDRAHTPIIFTDQAITIGPRISPGATACLHCELTSDPHLPWSNVALVSQVWRRRAPTATPANVTLASWHASTMVATPGGRYQLRITPATGVSERREIPDQAGCGCLGLD